MDAVSNMAGIGIMQGTGGNFSPKGTYSGAQAIVTMLRIYNMTLR
ncbi:MAG: hypothetical protein GXY20_00740 [Clostridiales bacterium]|nr:hypothetical protein [Clostridiales bacterium]